MRGLGAIAVLMAGAAVARSAPPQPSTADPAPIGNAPRVSEVVVPGGPRPKLATTFPAQGATVAAGVLALKVTFDQSMLPTRWSFAPVDGSPFPVCLAAPRLLADKKTFVLLCQVKANTAYAVQVGGPPGFAAADGRDMAPVALAFSTGEDIVDNLHDALDEAGLTDADDPVMTWNDDGKSPPQSPPKPAPPGGG